MKKLLGAILALVFGVGIGGASAYGVGLFRSNNSQWTETRLEFIPTGAMLAPLVFPDGRLSAYVTFEIQLEVPSREAEMVKAKLPVLMNAVNMRTYRTPMAAGPDGLVPELDSFRKVVIDAAAETYGQNLVRRVVVTQASPA